MSVEARVATTGLLVGPVVVLLSGGRDSVCLLDLAVRLAGPVVALHVNYGLREAADTDEAHCRSLCERLGVPLEVVRAGEPEGNLEPTEILRPGQCHCPERFQMRRQPLHIKQPILRACSAQQIDECH